MSYKLITYIFMGIFVASCATPKAIDIQQANDDIMSCNELRLAFEKANQLTIFGKVLNNVYNNRILLFKYRQALATSSIVISLIFVLTNNFHKVRYTILTDPYGTEFVYDRFTGKLKKK